MSEVLFLASIYRKVYLNFSDDFHVCTNGGRIGLSALDLSSSLFLSTLRYTFYEFYLSIYF